MLAIATTGATDYGTAQELLGLGPFHSGRLATFTARLRQDGILEPVTAAICQLARKLAARQLGIRNANLTSQVRQLETTVGTALLGTRADGRLTLTAYGERFARDVCPTLESLAQSRNQSTIHAP